MIKKLVAQVTLPNEPSIPCTNIGDYSILLYGQEKIGKTSLAAEFPDALFFMFEPGARGLRIYQREINNWAEFKSYLDILDDNKGRFSTLVMDTADIAYQMCLKYVCDKEGIEHPSDAAYGKGWNKVNSEFGEQVNKMLKLNRGVIFTSHAVEKEIKTRLGEEYQRIIPTMSGGARNILEAIIDVWGYMYYDADGRRYLRIRGNDHIAAGTRLQYNFINADVINLGLNALQGYKNIMSAFNNELSTKKKLILGGMNNGKK